MQKQGNTQVYDPLTIVLHWGMTLMIIGLFFLGEYMVDLDYYDPWYIRAPDIHRSLGAITAMLLVMRLGWRWFSVHPMSIGRRWERLTALWVHRAFYALIAAVVISGYLITTADGQALSVFGWFEIPATLYGIENQEDIAGEFHEVLTDILMVLMVFHGLAALKHHFIDHDQVLRRMLGIKPGRSQV